MEYLVSTENTPYYHWQLELLIESFKYHKCESDLLVALAESTAPAQVYFCRNIIEHKRIYGHQNIGSLRGYAGLNKLYSLQWSIQYDKIKQPFAYIPADVVLRNKVDMPFVDNGLPEILFSPDSFFTIDAAEEAVGPFWEWAKKSKSDYETRWIPLGSVVMFNNVPVEVFERATVLCEALALQQLLAGKPIWQHTDKLAWALNLSDFLGQIVMRGDYGMTMNMLGDGDSPFIHYEHGLPPVFNKAMFQYTPPNYVAFGDPFEILAAHSPSPNAHFVSQLAQTSLDARLE